MVKEAVQISLGLMFEIIETRDKNFEAFFKEPKVLKVLKLRNFCKLFKILKASSNFQLDYLVLVMFYC